MEDLTSELNKLVANSQNYKKQREQELLNKVKGNISKVLDHTFMYTTKAHTLYKAERGETHADLMTLNDIYLHFGNYSDSARPEICKEMKKLC